MTANPIFKSHSVLAWALTAETGEKMVYAHRAHSGERPDPESARLEAHKAHTMGLVFLCQRRCDKGWDYEATRISPKTAKLLRNNFGGDSEL